MAALPVQRCGARCGFPRHVSVAHRQAYAQVYKPNTQPRLGQSRAPHTLNIHTLNLHTLNFAPHSDHAALLKLRTPPPSTRRYGCVTHASHNLPSSLARRGDPSPPPAPPARPPPAP